jgi:hypothetical protein
MTGSLEEPRAAGWYRTTDGDLLCPLCHAKDPARGDQPADPEDGGACDICGRRKPDVEDLLTDDQLQRLAAGVVTVDEMIEILFGLGELF